VDTLPAPSADVCSGDVAAVQAVAAFIASGIAPTPLKFTNTQQAGGLSGTRVLRMLSVLDAVFSGKPSCCLAQLEEIRQSLHVELGSANGPNTLPPLEAAHLRRLLAFATASWAYLSAQARSAGASVEAHKIVEAARQATCMARDEPIILELEAVTLLWLDRREEMEMLIAPIIDAPWLKGWRKSFEDLLLTHDPPLLPPGASYLRLSDMFERRDWLDRAGARLPAYLSAQAAGRIPLRERQVRLKLTIAKQYLPNDAAKQELIGDSDDVDEPTIRGLREAFKARFGVLLPSVSLIPNDQLSPGQAIVSLTGKDAVQSKEETMALARQESWWAPLDAAPLPLLFLLVAAMRNLCDFNPDPPCDSREEAEARELMIADRFPYGQAAERLRDLLNAGVRPGAAVAALRLSIPADSALTLWGDDPHRSLLLLDRGSEDAFIVGLVHGYGLTVPQELVRNLVGSIQHRLRMKASGPSAGTLLVRDSALRPLMRALLQNRFPDLPVLALSEVTHDANLVPLEQPINAMLPP
jgi:hypothetical protein